MKLPENFCYTYVTILPLCWNIYVTLTQRCVCNAVIVTRTCNGTVNDCSVYHVYVNIRSNVHVHLYVHLYVHMYVHVYV